jgi:N-6 DNA Methylase
MAMAPLGFGARIGRRGSWSGMHLREKRLGEMVGELPADALTVVKELGPESVAYCRAEADLRALWAKLGNRPSMLLKCTLWQNLLRLVYGRDVATETLWLQHTYLVIVAKTIAARVAGFDADNPADLLSGRRFAAIGVLRAVEGDFFDWVLDDAAGHTLIVRLARHTARFRLHEVESDVLKVLYEALIDPADRHGLGEYYTPDWLAAKMVREAVDKPLSQRVLDPACGSGTFLFHGVRHQLAAARTQTDLGMHAEGACALIAGMDIHPVAAIVARVTYLLALGDALWTRRGDISIPVYIGDAMERSMSSLFAGRELIVSRPLYLSGGQRRFGVVIGNPPWLALRHMSGDSQKRFKALAKIENIYVGGKFATQNDLSALFFARAAALYLNAGGRIAFVMPLAAMTRGQFEKFRSGAFHSRKVQFDGAWVLDDDVQPLFPVPACVLFATAHRGLGKGLPDTVRRFSGELPCRDPPESLADKVLRVIDGARRPDEASYEEGSAYRSAFRQGATLVPRMLCLVERVQAGRLGQNPGMPFVTSRRAIQEKTPWKTLPGVEHGVECEFLRPVLLGESILPFRVFRTFEAIIPVEEDGAMLDVAAAARRGWTGLAGWMREAESVWTEHGVSEMSLVQRWNYHNELGAQFPVSRIRLVYSKAGALPVAAIVEDSPAAIDHKLYWAAMNSREEAAYLAAILNSEAARKKIETLQSRGQWGARDFDKVMFTLPIARFDPKNPLHTKLSTAGVEAEKIAAKLEIPQAMHFQTARRRVRQALEELCLSRQIDDLVLQLLGRSMTRSP